MLRGILNETGISFNRSIVFFLNLSYQQIAEPNDAVERTFQVVGNNGEELVFGGVEFAQTGFTFQEFQLCQLLIGNINGITSQQVFTILCDRKFNGYIIPAI